jgi:hypothetical protein
MRKEALDNHVLIEKLVKEAVALVECVPAEVHLVLLEDVEKLKEPKHRSI